MIVLESWDVNGANWIQLEVNLTNSSAIINENASAVFLDSELLTLTSIQVCFLFHPLVQVSNLPFSDSLSEMPFSKVTPFSSIIFVFITCFVLLSFVVYCYRFHVQRAACALYASDASRDTNVRMSQLDNEPDDLEPVIEEVMKPVVQPNAVVMLASAAAVSPYRLNPGYRRPPGGDSDNGYSTMTAHDDSEHLGPSCDPLLAGRDRQTLPVASAHSLGSSSRTSSPLDTTTPSSNEKSSLPPMTALPSSKGTGLSVIAQVHNVVDAL